MVIYLIKIYQQRKLGFIPDNKRGELFGSPLYQTLHETKTLLISDIIVA